MLGCLLVAWTAWSAFQLVHASIAGAGSSVNIASAEALKSQAELRARADAAIAQQKALQGQNDTLEPATTATTSTPVANTPPVEPARPIEPRPSGKKSPLTFSEYSDQSDAIEKAVADDPSLLSRTPGALALYKKLHAAGAKFKGAKGKADSPQEHIRQAELYAATVDNVRELYAKLHAR
ncbi:MAG: hypothetical protein H7Z43_00875 [Clostridia bacterium]|nr:hypothetical protein [Deltaproteobacteria bacterium]